LVGYFVFTIFDLSKQNTMAHTKFYYEIHVTGKNSFSTSIATDTEMDDDEIILKAYEEDKLEDDDCHHVDYVNQLTYEEWDEQFNFNK
jgi:hypothetical protein